MVRRLVQQKQARPPKQGSRERNSHPPATRKRARRHLLHLFGELKAAQDRTRARNRRRRANFLQLFVNPHQSVAVCSLIFGAHGRNQGFFLEQAKSHFVGFDDSDQRALVVRLGLLLHHVDVNVARYLKVAFASIQVAQKGRLASAVVADKAVTAAVGERQIRILKQGFAASKDAKLVHLDVIALGGGKVVNRFLKHVHFGLGFNKVAFLARKNRRVLHALLLGTAGFLAVDLGAGGGGVFIVRGGGKDVARRVRHRVVGDARGAALHVKLGNGVGD